MSPAHLAPSAAWQSSEALLPAVAPSRDEEEAEEGEGEGVVSLQLLGICLEHLGDESLSGV